MTNGINFYSKVDYILEFLNKRSSVCAWEVCPLAARGSRRRDVSGFIIPRCQQVQGMQVATTVQTASHILYIHSLIHVCIFHSFIYIHRAIRLVTRSYTCKIISCDRETDNTDNTTVKNISITFDNLVMATLLKNHSLPLI